MERCLLLFLELTIMQGCFLGEASEQHTENCHSNNKDHAVQMIAHERRIDHSEDNQAAEVANELQNAIGCALRTGYPDSHPKITDTA